MKKDFFSNNKILFKINLLYLIALIPIIIFSYLKNGLAVYQAHKISFFGSLQYLCIPILIVILVYCLEILWFVYIKKDKDFDDVINSSVPLICCLCYLVSGPRDSLFITVPLIVVTMFITKFLKKVSINQVALFNVVLYGILYALGLANNANFLEASQATNYSLMQSFIGYGVGAIGVTSGLLGIIGYIILLFNPYYKKSIPLYCIVFYFVIAGTMAVFKADVTITDVLVGMFNNGIIFASVFVAALSIYSPMMSSGKLAYGMLFGLIAGILVAIGLGGVSPYIAILFASIVTPLLDRIK